MAGYIFLRPYDVFLAGHVGWGFHLGNSRYFYGSTETILGQVTPYIQAGQNNGWWGEEGTFEMMLRAMRVGKTKPYQKYKKVGVSGAKPAAAKQVALLTKLLGYGLIGNNCMDHSHMVLKAYGCSLPLPISTFPNLWFGLTSGTEHSL